MLIRQLCKCMFRGRLCTLCIILETPYWIMCKSRTFIPCYGQGQAQDFHYFLSLAMLHLLRAYRSKWSGTSFENILSTSHEGLRVKYWGDFVAWLGMSEINQLNKTKHIQTLEFVPLRRLFPAQAQNTPQRNILPGSLIPPPHPGPASSYIRSLATSPPQALVNHFSPF